MLQKKWSKFLHYLLISKLGYWNNSIFYIYYENIFQHFSTFFSFIALHYVTPDLSMVFFSIISRHDKNMIFIHFTLNDKPEKTYTAKNML